MCLFPRLIINKKYVPNKKNDYRPPKLRDVRLKYVPIGCGKCLECKKQKANAWRTRLHEELKYSNEKAYFITLTISNETFINIAKEIGIKHDNALCKILVRRWLERIRKIYKRSIKHWLITELGEENARIHLHGFLFTNKDITDILNIWKYGNTYCGEYCNAKTINYTTKYVLKVDKVHKDYEPIILCSSGIGKAYIENNKIKHKFKKGTTNETYRLPDGNKTNLPIYYRNHLFSEEERERLWIEKLNEHKIYVNGIEVDIATEKGLQTYETILKQQQIDNMRLGYGDASKEWRKKDYNTTLRVLNAKRSYQKLQKL